MQVHQSEEFRIRGQVQPAAEILCSATVTAAELLGLAGQAGVVTAGALADLLVVDGNPLEDAGVLAEPGKNLSAVIQDGRVVVDRLG
jgi:imidazolonepropionase-like amidohydrolase